MKAHFPGTGCFHFGNVLASRIAYLGTGETKYSNRDLPPGVMARNTNLL